MPLELSTCQLTKIDDDGFIGAQIHALGDEDSGVTPDQLSHPFGFISRCVDPADGVGCSLFSWQVGSRERFCWLGDDPRYVKKYPPIKKGGSCQYASDGCFSVFDPETHTWTQYVPYATGKAHLSTVGVDGGGKPIVEFVHGDGMAITMLEHSLVIKNADGSVYIELNDSSAVINGNVKIHGAVEINGLKITPTGDIVTGTGVSLMAHLHPTALGPSGSPIPTPGI
ncbi:MAG: hypothetical protein H0U64_05335 [Gemmatimonadaceae bacterium]|nr:hypothetical protein [Gemmatimonadaceae bacterium]